MKKFLRLLLMLVVILAACVILNPTEAHAASVDDLTFALNADGNSYSVKKCKTAATGDLVIPATYNEKPVTIIDYNAFYSCSKLTGVSIPDSITAIGSSAFYDCDSLTCVTIPDSVTTIGSWLFNRCSGLTSVIIGNGITTISKDVFNSCTALTSVTIGDGVTTIADYAFAYCSGLSDIVIPNGVTTVGVKAFVRCRSLDRITIPDSVTTIGDSAFWDCTGLTSATINSSVTTIGSNAFEKCNNLTDVYYIGTQKQWEAISIETPNDILLDATLHFVDYCTASGYEHTESVLPGKAATATEPGLTEGKKCSACAKILVAQEEIPALLTFELNYNATAYYVIDCQESVAGKLIIPATYNGKPVTAIGSYAFKDCKNLTEITIPDSVDVIFEWAFENCSGLTEIVFPDSVVEVLYCAFDNCTGLKRVVFEGNDPSTFVEATAFEGCSSLESLTLSSADHISGLGLEAQYPLGGLVSASKENGLATSQRYYTYIDTGWSEPEWGCTSDLFYIPASLKSVTVKGGEIVCGFFENCTGLKKVTLGDGVTAIGKYALSGCTGITDINIPIGVTTIDRYAFERCDNLSDVYYDGTRVQWDAIAIETGNQSLLNATLHFTQCESNGHTEEILPVIAATCTETGLTAGKKCSVCNEILVAQEKIPALGHTAEIIAGKVPTATETGLTEGKKCAVCGEILVAQEVIPACPQTATEGYLTFTLNEDGLGYSVTDCDTSATGVLTIPETFCGLPVTAIGYCTFYNCDSLTEVMIPDSVTAIAGSAFWDCDKLTTVHIPDSVTGSIGQRTFARCGSLTDVTIGKSITSIDHYAFYNCTSLKTITIPNGVTSIGYQVFQGCNTLATVSLPDTLTDIGENAFSGCYRLASITIPESVQSIGSSAFSSCTFLTEIVIPEGITRVEKRTFYGCTRLAKVTIPQSVTAIGDYAFSGCTGLTDVYYSGTRWDAVTVGNYNVPLLDATLHIPDACADGHTYENDFDADCNICGEVRELNNTFKFENYRVVFADPDTTHKNLRVEVYKLGDKSVEDPTDEKALKAIDASPATHWGAGNINKILITEAGNYVLLLKYNFGTGSAIKVPLQISVSADPKLIIDKNNKLTVIDNDGANINHRVVVYYLGDKTVEDIYDEAALQAIDPAAETVWQKTRINRLTLTKGGNYVLHLCYNVGTGNKMTVAQQFAVESIPTLSVNINNRVIVTEENAENKNHRAVVYYLGENTVDDPYSESAVKAAAASTSKTYWGLKEINGIEMKEGGNYIVHLYYNVGTSEKRTLALDVTLTERPALSVDENNKLVVTYSDASITNPRAYIYNLGDKMVGDLYDEAALKAITTPTQVWGLSEILRKTLTEPGQYVIHLHYNVGTGAKKTVALQVTI